MLFLIVRYNYYVNKIFLKNNIIVKTIFPFSLLLFPLLCYYSHLVCYYFHIVCYDPHLVCYYSHLVCNYSHLVCKMVISKYHLIDNSIYLQQLILAELVLWWVSALTQGDIYHYLYYQPTHTYQIHQNLHL